MAVDATTCPGAKQTYQINKALYTASDATKDHRADFTNDKYPQAHYVHVHKPTFRTPQ